MGWGGWWVLRPPPQTTLVGLVSSKGPPDRDGTVEISYGIVPSQEVIAYCQVGMRASVDLFALHLIGYDKLRNYYGAWEEWGNRDDLPLATKK